MSAPSPEDDLRAIAAAARNLIDELGDIECSLATSKHLDALEAALQASTYRLEGKP